MRYSGPGAISGWRNWSSDELLSALVECGDAPEVADWRIRYREQRAMARAIDRLLHDDSGPVEFDTLGDIIPIRTRFSVSSSEDGPDPDEPDESPRHAPRRVRRRSSLHALD